MLQSGGIEDQPEWYVEAMNRMSGKDNEMQMDDAKKRDQEFKRQQQMRR